MLVNMSELGGCKTMNCICIHCRKSFNPNPRIKNQKYCNEKECQKARKAKWQREKMAKDLDYKSNQKACQQQWQRGQPDYYRDYRAKHPEYVERNKLLQITRNAKRRKDGLVRLIAKMDALNSICSMRKWLFKLVPQDSMIAKMDSLIVKLVAVQGVRRP